MPEIHAVPRGAMEGLPAVTVDLSDANFDDALAIVRAFGTARAPGIQAVFLQGARWGADAFEDALLTFMSDARSGDVTVWAQRSCLDVDWSMAPVWWVLDCSPLLDHEVTYSGLVDAINAMPYMPTPVEVVVEKPHPSNLSASHLDELYTRLTPDHAWVYVHEEHRVAALHAASKAATPWGVRVLPED